MINWYKFFICKKVNRKGSCQLNYLFTSNGGKGDHRSTALIGSTRFAVMREVFHLCGRVWFQLVSLAAVFWMTHHAPPKELPQKFLLGSVAWHPKTAARETRFHRWVKNAVVSSPCQEVFLPVFPIQFCPPPQKIRKRRSSVEFDIQWFVFYLLSESFVHNLVSAWRNRYMKGKNPYGTLAHRASHYIYFHFIIYLN